MTSYASRADVALLGLPQHVLDALASDEVGAAAVVDQALAAASSLADSYLRSRYRLPLVSWGDDLRERVCHLAAYQLLSVRGFNPELGADQNIRLRYEDAITWLKAIAAGLVHPDVQDSAPTPLGVAPAIVSAPPRGW